MGRQVKARPMRPPFEGVFERMKAASGLKNASAVALSLGLEPQALSNYKKRGYVPADLIIRFAMEHGVSIDSIAFGAKDTLPVRLGWMTAGEIACMERMLKIMRNDDLRSVALHQIIEQLEAKL